MSLAYVVADGDIRLEDIEKRLRKDNKKVLKESEVQGFQGKVIYVFAPNFKLTWQKAEGLKDDSTVVCGRVENGLTEAAADKELNIVDLSKDESFACDNAVYTAESTLLVLFSKVDRLLEDYKIALVGMGRCGLALAKYLYALSADFTFVTASVQKAVPFFKAVDYKDCDFDKFDIIINTAPATVIDEQTLQMLTVPKIIIDLASPPYGLNHNLAKELGHDSAVYPALPSKYRARAAADSIYKIIKKLED